MAAASILQVTRIGGGRLEAKPLHLRAGAPNVETNPANGGSDLERVEPSAKIGNTHKPTPAAVVSALERWAPFVCNDGRQLRVSATLEPDCELKGFTRIGLRMIRRVIVVHSEQELSPQRIAMLSAADLLRFDVAMILRSLDRLKGSGGAEDPLSMIVPISFVSLSSRQGRAELVKHLKAARELVKMGVICEICGMLLAAASLVRPFTVLVAGRLLSPTPELVRQLAGAGLQALSFDYPPALGDAQFIGWAAGAIGASKQIVRSVLVCCASPTRRASTLAALGATHARLAGQSPVAPRRVDGLRLKSVNVQFLIGRWANDD
jgi:hypothetical protein